MKGGRVKGVLYCSDSVSVNINMLHCYKHVFVCLFVCCLFIVVGLYTDSTRHICRGRVVFTCPQPHLGVV